MITGYFEELELGTSFVTEGRTITEADVVGFAGLSGDLHPMHMDETYAARGPFGSRVAHGLLTVAVTSGLMTFSRTSMRAFYGIDKLRFLHPVRIGDTIRVEGEIAGLEPREDGTGLVTLAVSVRNQDNLTVVMMRMIYLVSCLTDARAAAIPQNHARA